MVTEVELKNEVKELTSKYNSSKSKDKKHKIYLEIMKMEIMIDKIRK